MTHQSIRHLPCINAWEPCFEQNINNWFSIFFASYTLFILLFIVGPLNDIRQFETNNNTWVSVTVDSSSTSSSGSSPPEHSVSSFDTPSLERDVNTSIVNKQDTDDTLPRGRYFHASEIEQSRRLVYIHGGLGADAETLSDFWRFNLHDHRWTLIQVFFLLKFNT